MRGMQAKDVNASQVLWAVAATMKGIGASRRDVGAFFPDVPEKVLLAKLRRLIRAGKLNGCDCGCRGDFTFQKTAP